MGKRYTLLYRRQIIQEVFMTGTDRKSEEKYLKQTLQIVEKNISEYTGEVSRMQSEIDEMLEHYHDADVELWTLLNNTITMNEHMKRALFRNERAKTKPYFGRIIFDDKKLKKTESLYIGKGGISSDKTTQIVVDWRAPVANAYYENGLGDCSYSAPDGTEIPIHLSLKRTFEIENGELHGYVDTEVVANDDLLMKYLSKNKEAVLGEIVATIQKEQNEIIRKSPLHNCIVQGVAGSGKTTVAMHRISYILYNYRERFRPEDFYIVGSNEILLNYITGVLPDLDVYGVKQMTMEQLLTRLLYEEWDGKTYQINYTPDIRDAIKGTEEWFDDLLTFISDYEKQHISCDSVYLNPRQFVEGLVDGKSGIYDKREEDRKNHIPAHILKLYDTDAITRYVEQNPAVSVQSKINMLNERLIGKIKEEFLNNSTRYTEPEKRAILRAYKTHFGPLTFKGDIYTIYKEFLANQAYIGKSVTIPVKTLDVYDLAALALIYKYIKETEIISEAHHIVIDEAQDFGMMIYKTINACIKDCTYTIMGDTSQNIHFGYGLTDWTALRRLLLNETGDSFNTLRKSYRNTIEISDFATNILKHGSFPIYPVEPIIRHGKQVSILPFDQKTDMGCSKIAEICQSWQKEGYETIAVVCKDEQESTQIASILQNFIEIRTIDKEHMNFGNGIMVLPVNLTKGLEFDTVLLYNPDRKAYPNDDGHAKLLYVACTRALHELTILANEDITGLISDPIPENRKQLSNAVNSNVSEVTNHPIRSEQIRPVKARTNKPVIVTAKKPEIKEVSALTRMYSANPDIKKVPVKEDAPMTKKVNDGQIHFGDMPSNDILKVSGHARINQSIRWVSKESDGVYFQSQYGTLRVVPVTGNIFRISFSKGSRLIENNNSLIKAKGGNTRYVLNQSMSGAEIKTPEASVMINKANGSLQFYNANKQLLFAEDPVTSRLQDRSRYCWFLDLKKSDKLYAFYQDEPLLSLRSSGRYLSDSRGGVPLIFSDKGYGFVPAVSSSIFCDIAAYGTYFSEEGDSLDYYVIICKQQKDIENAYHYLLGE